MSHQNQNPLPSRPHSSITTALVIAIAFIVISTLAFYLFFPLLGIVLAISATAWTIVAITIIFFSILLLLFFIIPSVFILLGSGLAAIWVILAIILFPVLFPILIPIFIILLFIAYARRKKN